VSFDYQVPIGRSRTIGKGMNKFLDGIIGGWELSTIISGSSGAPLGVTQSASNLWNSANQRPNLVGDPSLPGSSAAKLNQYFNANAFQNVAPDIIGSSPRFLSSYRGPALWNEDAALMKNFNVREKKYLQLRLEAYAVKNAPQWGMPNTSFGDTSFGQITSSTGQRTLQVAAKFYY
jgi:hypothetical protein